MRSPCATPAREGRRLEVRFGPCPHSLTAQLLHWPPTRRAGELPCVPLVAIVGARAADKGRLRAVPALIASLQRAGLGLVSGGARGVDVTAHRAALASDLPQLAILPCHRDKIYPPEHSQLFEQIAQHRGSGLAFALEPGQNASRSVFASRNRFIIDVALALIVVDAQLRSGSLLTGNLALRRGKPVLACHGSRGCSELGHAGAQMIQAEDFQSGQAERAQQALATWLQGLARNSQAGGAMPHLPAQLVSEPHGGPAWPDHLVWIRARFATAPEQTLRPDAAADGLEQLCALTELESLGWVYQVGPGCYRLSAGRTGSSAAQRPYVAEADPDGSA